MVEEIDYDKLFSELENKTNINDLLIKLKSFINSFHISDKANLYFGWGLDIEYQKNIYYKLNNIGFIYNEINNLLELKSYIFNTEIKLTIGKNEKGYILNLIVDDKSIESFTELPDFKNYTNPLSLIIKLYNYLNEPDNKIKILIKFKELLKIYFKTSELNEVLISIKEFDIKFIENNTNIFYWKNKNNIIYDINNTFNMKTYLIIECINKLQENDKKTFTEFVKEIRNK